MLSSNQNSDGFNFQFCPGQTCTMILNVHDALVHQQPTSEVREIVETCANMTGVESATTPTLHKVLQEIRDLKK